jgi:hypothetical protein
MRPLLAQRTLRLGAVANREDLLMVTFTGQILSGVAIAEAAEIAGCDGSSRPYFQCDDTMDRVAYHDGPVQPGVLTHSLDIVGVGIARHGRDRLVRSHSECRLANRDE